ncbi:8TM microsporidial transmembrane domain-containing protein [Hamiltosporidium magnivora]|uniref:8TM microsporidial transmembrane domain-containing protein n=1 Tax=Hamiltosporidium magnivora TaxID=148818 RepID=A0A4Q9LGZ0_9MICR|nr:8TM microsporidial transmembrane domain-containing protein [Hamiltosporidium magnivora]
MKNKSLKYFLLGCTLLAIRKYYKNNLNISFSSININSPLLGYEIQFRTKYCLKEENRNKKVENTNISHFFYKYINIKYFAPFMSLTDILVSIYTKDIKYYLLSLLLPYDISSIENLLVLLLLKEKWYSLFCGFVLSFYSYYYLPFLILIGIKFYKRNIKIRMQMSIILGMSMWMYSIIFSMFDKYNINNYKTTPLYIFKSIFLIWYNNYKDLYNILHYPSQNMFWYLYMHMYKQYSLYVYSIFTITYFFIFTILPVNISYVHIIVLLFFKPCNYKNFILLPFLEGNGRVFTEEKMVNKERIFNEGWVFFCVVGFLQMCVSYMFCFSLVGNTNFIYWLNFIWFIIVFVVISHKYKL